MSSIAIQSIDLIENQITVLFDKIWFQENITTLRTLLLSDISSLNIKEVVIGADLESVRFQWLDTEFILNFDYYSQSCWFEAQDPHSLAETLTLFTLLTQNNEHYV
ncbi:DUF3630 family protein [Candidatus Colwellia aromaticivorans]|uniref:DUF3630 family protein n=1 Tax=Candidatus Colwellia aromaticivorans TaxID=2267621 RepID=UPI000DF17C8B|nr:DUF3630 family protein [Candidatus Colwellia aromaticivorans]